MGGRIARLFYHKEEVRVLIQGNILETVPMVQFICTRCRLRNSKLHV